MDISNGPGVRVSVFMQGCTFNCKNCFNPETHNFSGGEEFTEDTINKVLELCKPDYIEGLSILGGEPLCPENVEGIIIILRLHSGILLLCLKGYSLTIFVRTNKII